MSSSERRAWSNRKPFGFAGGFPKFDIEELDCRTIRFRDFALRGNAGTLSDCVWRHFLLSK